MNTKTLLRLLVLTSAFSLQPLALLTASPLGTAFTYQGRLADAGNPAQGSYDLRFAIWDAAADGNIVVGPVTNSPVGVTNGLFTSTLDFGAGVFDGNARWLEIAVRPNGTAAEFTLLSPRQELTPTPYTLYAPTAGVAGNATYVTGPVAASQLTGTISSNNISPGTITTPMIALGAVGSDQLAAGAVTTIVLADGAVTSAKLKTVPDESRWVLTTIANPTPADSDWFGGAVAAVGSDRVLIGAKFEDTGAISAGAAYLFNTDGTLLTTFTNPTPEDHDHFGAAVAGVGLDRVLIGADQDNTGGDNAGAAYLFSTDGTLLTTFTNPAQAGDLFGGAVAAVGTDRVLIGAKFEDTGASGAGAAYLFNTDGTLLTTFTNPTPAAFDWFGGAVAAVGNDRVLIAAYRDDTGAEEAGAAHLFSTNGTLLTTFTNPTPAEGDWFGEAVAAVGSDRVLIGASRDDTGAEEAGAAYLFSTNGTLLTTFPNPTPTTGYNFGDAVAAVGSDRVLIGAPFANTGASSAGAAYLFSTDGTLLTTFPNPTPAVGEYFGYALAAAGSDGVLIGANRDIMGAVYAGAVYVFKPGFYIPGLVAEGVRVGAITTASLADGAVGTAQLAAGAVTAVNIANNTITSDQLAAGAVTTSALADGAVTAAKMATSPNWLAQTFTNPTPASDDRFGQSVAMLGTDRVLVGVGGDDTVGPNAGAAYLFDTDGTLLTTFTDPTPADYDAFGREVAAVGSGRVLITATGDDSGGPDTGTAYLFDTDGTLLTTFTNPTPAANDYFGDSVAAVGTNRVLIGAYSDDTGAINAGAAYLFDTDGTLLTTFTGPTPTANDWFAYSVAAVGPDRVLIGHRGDDTGATDAGAAHLFSTDGTLLITFTNPTPADYDVFGYSVASVGTDRVLIGAIGDDTGTNDAGAAYLFSTDGTLLTTFTNPTPAANDSFAGNVVAVGTDRVLIGALGDDTGGASSGTAYLFSTDGTLLITFTNPTPADGDWFGYSVAAAGNDGVLIGSRDDAGAPHSGALYLFRLENYMPGLVAEGVRSGSITTDRLADGAVSSAKLAAGAVTAANIASNSITSDGIADGAVTPAKLDSTIGLWSRSGYNVYRSAGKVGIGTANPASKLEVQGGPIKATGGLIIETRTSDPPSPAVGQIWLRTD